MDNLDRMYRHLVRTIRAKFPQYLTQPFDVAALQQTILPYRHHRRELGLETNEDYEITLSELLSGDRDYLIVDERMRDALKAELKAVNPDPTAFKQFAPAMVALSPNALRSLDAGPDDPSTPLRPIAVPDPSVSTSRPAPEPTLEAAPEARSSSSAHSADSQDDDRRRRRRGRRRPDDRCHRAHVRSRLRQASAVVRAMKYCRPGAPSRSVRTAART